MHVPCGDRSRTRDDRCGDERGRLGQRGGVPRGGISRQRCTGYDASMRKPSLSLDTFVAALAVLGVTASTGCSKADRASVAPEPAAAVAPGAPKTEGAPAAAAPPPEQAAQATGAPAPAADPAAPADARTRPSTANAPAPNAPSSKAATGSAVGATALDGGVKRAADGDDKKKAGMSCGAGTCSADMKKGTGN